MGTRSKRAPRCERCQQHLQHCLCATIPRLTCATRLVLVMHHRELHRPTATGPLALAALTNSALSVHGLRDAPLDLSALHHEGRRVLVLYPSENAKPLTRELVDADPRPITLVVPDGSWRQASRMPRRVPGLEAAQPVILPESAPSQWGVRREPKQGGLATLEAIARAFGVIEGAQVQAQLEALLTRASMTTLASRGEHAPPPALDPLPVLYRDEHLVAVNKPSGVLVHRGWGVDGVPALQRVRDQLGQRVYPVHRLDRGTSGVLLFALSSEVAAQIQALFTSGEVHKRYLALCRGCSPDLQRVDHALAPERGGAARPAVTSFRLLGTFERYGLFEAVPHTGRTHQIRRHLKHASHPIIGDTRYGKGEHNRLFRDRFGFNRLALHCASLGFVHPRSGARLHIEAPVTGELLTLLHQLALPVR